MVDNFYFDVPDLSIKNVFILARLSRKFIMNLSIVELKSGDILEIVFSKATIIYTFEGICIGIRHKKFLSDKTSLILRNVLISTGVELICSFFSTQICLKLAILDYKRKAFFYIKSKLYYLRRKINRASRVKS